MKKSKARRLALLPGGYAVVAQDGASHVTGLVQKRARAPRGAGATAPPALPGQGSCPLGAPRRDGFRLSSCYRANGDIFSDFPGRLRRKFGKVPVLADNAGCHKSRKVTGAVRGHGGDVVPGHFPAHAPDPSPAGGQWRNTGLHAANGPCGSADEMKEPVGTMPCTGEIKAAKMSDYLM